MKVVFSHGIQKHLIHSFNKSKVPKEEIRSKRGKDKYFLQGNLALFLSPI